MSNRTSTNDDGRTFNGYDDGDGITTWISSNGDVDCETDTPDDRWDDD